MKPWRTDEFHKENIEGSETRGLIAIFVLMLLAISPAASKCACSAGGESYNFLGDSAVDINMDSYDEFVRDNAAVDTSVRPPIQATPAETAEESRLSLDLADSSHVDLAMKKIRGEYSGEGNIIQANGTEQVSASASLTGQKLSLRLVTLSGATFRFNLAKEGSTVLGDYSEKRPKGENLTGIANGKWVA